MYIAEQYMHFQLNFFSNLLMLLILIFHSGPSFPFYIGDPGQVKGLKKGSRTMHTIRRGIQNQK